MTQDGERPQSSEQKLLFFNGFDASFSKSPFNNIRYYHKSYDKPPPKSVLYANLCEAMKAVELA